MREILRLLARSGADAAPVLDAVARMAVDACGATFAAVFRRDGDVLRAVAHHNLTPEALELLARPFPEATGQAGLIGWAIGSESIVHVADAAQDPLLGEAGRAVARRLGAGSFVGVPLRRGDGAFGALGVARRSPAPFSDDLIAWLGTLADLAVVALEQARRTAELDAGDRQLAEAREQQAATSEILRVISSSPSDVRPAFDTILANALRLCEAQHGAIFTFDGRFRTAAAAGLSDEFHAYLREAEIPPGPETPLRRVGLEARVHHVTDLLTDPTCAPPEIFRREGMRTALAVPLVKEGRLIGAFAFHRDHVRPFTARQIALLTTFADQAVIAIETVRLFRELAQRTRELGHSVEQLTALGEVSRAVSSTLDLETVLTTIVSRAVQISDLDGGVVFEYEEETETLVQRAATETGGALARTRRGTRISKGQGLMGRVAVSLEPAQVADIAVSGAYEGPQRDNLLASGIRALLAVPMVREHRLIGCLGVSRNRPGPFPAETIELLRRFATQSALAIQNARLYRALEQKSRELEAASRHKSEFLANMSHELRTPLNAVIGFSEALIERMFGELTAKQEEYLQDIHASGQHLLSLINDVLDLSKVEAGHMELELGDFDLPAAIDAALTLVRERAGRRGIALRRALDDRVGAVRADERKVRQVLLNLLSNAVKFTPEGGRIEVRAAPVDGAVAVSVSDTGIGIAPADHAVVFEEFRQVGTASRKVEGTGLGLALCKKLVELHGGRIWVESAPGAGATFTFTLPARPSG